MAIDTRLKRLSAIAPGLPFRGMLPAGDGSIAENDWPVPALMYAGIQADFPAPPPPEADKIMQTISISIGIGLGGNYGGI